MMTRRHKYFAIAVAILLAVGSKIATADIESAPDAPQPLSPYESAAAMQLPEGFRIELVASEPLIQDPSCIAFDERGRLFVCELHGYNLEGHLDVVELNKTGVLDTKVQRIRWERIDSKIREEAKQNQYGTVKLLTDTDGDGQMDKVDVWADHLPTCYGILPARGGLIVVCAPDILYLADRDGDGKAEVRETLFTGFRIELLERGINNPRWGLDNWIYVGAGGGGGDIRGPKLAEPVRIGNSDFRIKADGSAIEPVNGSVGTYGMTLSDFGDRFPSGGGQPAVYALPLPYRYLKRNPYVPTPQTNHSAANYSRGYPISSPHPWRVKRGQDPAWVKFYGQRETDSGYFTGGCGGEIYRADLFGQPYRGNFFYCEPSLNIVHRSILEPDGPGYKARRAAGEEQSEFLASTDQWFRPINLRIGPDGALYIVDMYREIIEDYSAIPRFLQQQYGVVKGDDKGRIWRLRPRSTSGREFVDLASWTTDELVRATGDSDAWWRQTAQRLLIERRDPAAAPALSAQVRDAKSPLARLHALYTLDGLGELKNRDVDHALDDSSHGVRMHALRLADRWLESDDALLAKVIAMTNDPHPSVRLQLAMTLGESHDPRATTALADLSDRYGDERWMSAAILSSARDSAGTLLVALLGTPELSPGARTLLAPLAATLAGRGDGLQMASVLENILAQDEIVQTECLKGFVTGLSRGTQSVAKSQDEWESVKRLLGSGSSQVRALAVKLGARLRLTESPEFQATFAAAAGHALDMDRTVEQRQQAVELLADAPYATLARTVSTLLDARQPPAMQLAAIQALAVSNDDRVGAALLEGWKGLTPQLRGAVLEAIFVRENRLPALLNAIENKVIHAGDVNALRREQLTNNSNEQIAARASALFENPAADAQLQQRIARYQQALAGRRNTKRGAEVFAKHCLACHKMKEEGYEVGPELGSVLNKPDEAILLDLLDPNSHIESEYASYLVVTKSGLTFSGILASDSATSVTLRKEKGVTETILRKDIEIIQASHLSIMPSNLHEQIGRQDAADLIAYLREALSRADVPTQ